MPAVRELRPEKCPIGGGTESFRLFSYSAPPRGEVGFPRPAGEAYRREIWQFNGSRHMVSRHQMGVATSYSGDYVDATYGGVDGMRAAFDRVVGLPPEKSDNAGRVHRVREFAATHFTGRQPVKLLDVGAGLGVFPHAARKIGWDCTAIDPDKRAVDHLEREVGVNAICDDFMTVANLGRFDIVTFNKVLEHVNDPVAMLHHAHAFLAPHIELPDGEMAAEEGQGREEFFIEHLHIFSFASTVMLANQAGFAPLAVERHREPSGKFTLRTFLVPDRDASRFPTAA